MNVGCGWMRGIAAAIFGFAVLTASVGVCAQESVGEVGIGLESFGLENVSRAGEWTGVSLSLTDHGDEPRNVIVRLKGEDPDGDPPLYERAVTLNPGAKQRVWLYVRLLHQMTRQTSFEVTVHEAMDDAGNSNEGFAVGRLLARTTISPARVLSSFEGMIGVVGAQSMGLDLYGESPSGEAWATLGHERTEVIRGIKAGSITGGAGSLPDRWMGLMGLEALVWADGDPSELGADRLRGRAIREWVARGGHLIVVLPGIAQAWTSPQALGLYEDFLPAVRINTKEDVSLDAYRALLTWRDVPLPESATVHDFDPVEGYQATDAIHILNGPDGKAVVVRRLIGTGAVTMIGLDLMNRRLMAQRVPEADVFWHRVLGRRGRLMPNSELKKELSMVKLQSRTPVVYYDEKIASEIAKTGKAALGVILGVVVFLVYWALAGPISFGVLRKKGKVRYSWLAYVGCAFVFTLIAWGGANAMKPSRSDISHVTLIEHVYGQNLDRARSWMSVLIPRYGEAELSVSSGELFEGRELHHAMASWDAPPPQSTLFQKFPDARGYRVESRMPDTLRIPVRSTVKQIRVDWAGGPRWGMPQPTQEVDGTGRPGIRFSRKGELDAGLLVGKLVHDLPGVLHDVVLVVNRVQKPLRKGQVPGSSLVMGGASMAFKIPVWEPGTALDLSRVTKIGRDASGGKTQLSAFLTDSFLEGLVPRPRATAALNAGSIDLTDGLTAAAFFDQLPPPEFAEQVTRSRALARRAATHTWGSRWWFTQPCVIIVGQLGGVGDEPIPSPVPLLLDGKEVVSDGRVLVRWVYPLKEQPPRYTARKVEDE